MSVDDGLRPLFRKHLPPPVHWTMVEQRTGMQLGTPDSHVCIKMDEGPGVERWIEMKATKSWDVKMRPGQIGWHLAHHRMGGLSFVAVRRRTRGVDDLYLFRGFAVRELKAFGLSPLRDGWRGAGLPAGALVGHWSGGPARWHWPAVRAALVARWEP
jgi:hypothetical protein